MKYCMHCGGELHDEAVVCVKCGRSVESPRPTTNTNNDDAMNVVVKVFLILGCVAQGWLIIPLAWCLPITISIFHAMRDNRTIGTGLKICSLLFVNTIAGICLLCINDNTK